MTKKQLFVVCTLACVSTTGLHAQQPISAIKTDTVAASSGNTYPGQKAYGGAASISNSYTAFHFGANSGFPDNSKVVKSFTSNGSAYTYKTSIPTIVRLKRVENAAMTTYRSTANVPASVAIPTPRDLAYFEGVHTSGQTIDVKSPYIPKMEDMFRTNDISVGIDNLFANTGTNNINNIERIDVIHPTGVNVPVPAEQGFAVFERGDAQQHDPIVVALVTSLDANGDPLTYANTIVRVVTADYIATPGQTVNVYQPSGPTAGNYIIFRRDDTTELLKASDLIATTQGIGGTLIKYSDFGISPGTTVYGYSLLGNDFPTSGIGADVVDYTDATFFPTATSSATTAGGNDMATITGVVKLMKLSGNVYYDSTGLADNQVNGSTIYNPSGTPLYVNLVNASGVVVGVAPVQSDGSFSIEQMEFGNLSAQLSTTAGAVGSAAPAPSLPAGWSNAGETYGTDNLMGIGNETVAQANGIIPVRIGDDGIEDVHFGIEKMPITDNKTASIPAPAQDAFITLNGSGSNPPMLTGSDEEDQVASNSSLQNKAVAITSLPTNGELWYNGVKISLGGDNTNPPNISNPFYISNFDPNLLQFKATGTGYSSTTFSYAYIDDAGVMDNSPATYSISWAAPLPLHLISFEGQTTVQGTVDLHWISAHETGMASFEIEKSTDAHSYTTMGSVAAANNPEGVHEYQFSDTRPSEKNYYRLRMMNQDGSYTFSNVLYIQGMRNAQNTVTVYPNPFRNTCQLILSAEVSTEAKINVTDLSGKVFYTSVQQLKKGTSILTINDMASLPAGIYLLQVRTGSAVHNYKLIKE